MEEKRKYERTPIAAHVMLRAGEGESPLVRSGMIADISLGGIGLHLSQPIEDGIEVKLEISFSVEGGTRTETVQGKTIYSYHIQNTYYVGIEFDQELSPLHNPYLCKRIQNIGESY